MPIRIKDGSGSTVQLTSIAAPDGTIQSVQIAKSIVTAIGEGSIPNSVVSVKFGWLPPINTGQPPTDVWSLGDTVAIIAEKTTGAVVTVASDSADDAAAGTGAQKLVIEGIVDSGGVWSTHSELVTMNGLTPVSTTTTNWIAINRAFVDEVGNVDDANVGGISITHTGDVVAHIAATEGQTAQAFQTTPSDTITLVTGPYIGIIKSGTGKTLSGRLRSKEFGKGWRTRNFGEATSSGTSYVQTPAGDLPAFTVGEKARIKAVITGVSANGTGAVGGWGYIQLPTT